MTFYYVYTDGATSNNYTDEGTGGWAYAITKDDNLVLEKSGHVERTTNNQMELFAALEACHACDLIAQGEDCFVIRSDSSYLVNCYKQQWYKNWQKNGWVNSKKEPVKNKEYWESLIPYFEDKYFTFEKVKGHTGKKDWNDYVDKLAVAAKEN